MKIYCVTVDPSIQTDEVWSEAETMCELASNVIGDQYDLGTTWQVWVATTEKDMAEIIKKKLAEKYGIEVYIEVIERDVVYNAKLGDYEAEEVLGLAEFSEILGWKKQQVRNYMERAKKNGWPNGMFPEPDQYLASGPIWRKSTVKRYVSKSQTPRERR